MNPEQDQIISNRSEDERNEMEPRRATQPEQRAAISDRDDAAHEDAPYLPEQSATQAGERWRQVQAAFVDDPRKAVTEAHELVGELTQRIVDAFARERAELERQWSSGDNVSTEDLRVCLQRYRAFFSRLLPSVNKLTRPD